jgi:hypothetical protein
MRPLLEWGSTGKRQRHVRALAKNLCGGILYA